MPGLEQQIQEVKKSLNALSKTVNESKDCGRVHRDNSFNKNFSVILSSFEDVLVFAERLDSNTEKSIEAERVIQQRMKNEGEGKITGETQELLKVADRLTRANQTDFKALYVFSKIFLDQYTKLLYFLLSWRGIANQSVTAFFHSLNNYKGEDATIISFKEKCLKRLKAVDVFLTSYRDDFVVHAELGRLTGTWFINEMNGGVRFVHKTRPSVTPEELVYVIRNYAVLSSEFIIDNWLKISKSV